MAFQSLLFLSNLTNLSHGDDIKKKKEEKNRGGCCSDCPRAEKLEQLPVVNIYLAVNDRPAQNNSRE